VKFIFGGLVMDSMMDTFVELTDKALPEEDTSKFIEYIGKRERFRAGLMESLLRFTSEEATALLANELRMLKRLQGEKTKLFKELEYSSVPVIQNSIYWSAT
jgi:hypothetical protein